MPPALRVQLFALWEIGACLCGMGWGWSVWCIMHITRCEVVGAGGIKRPGCCASVINCVSSSGR